MAAAARVKNLYVSAVGRGGVEFLWRIRESFGAEQFDYLILVYDDADLSDFPGTVICAPGNKYPLLRKYLTRDIYDQYEFIFAWDDDIDITDFDVAEYLDVVARNRLDVAQPSLKPYCHWNHAITRQRFNHVGRITDFVEVMVPTFTPPALTDVLDNLVTRYPHSAWGWGYCHLFCTLSSVHRMGIVDCQSVAHTRPVGLSYDPRAQHQLLARILGENPRHSRFREFGLLE